MSRRDILKLVHFSSTGWFILSVGYLLVLALRQAGFRWWFIFSLSGYSALLVFLLISLYLFAVYRGVSRNQKTEIEHPLTGSVYYSVFYDVTPFLGSLAGVLGAIGISDITQYLLVTAYGALWTTFLVWIIVDPAVGLFEMLLPSIREHRRARLALAKAEREKDQLAKQRLLAEIEVKEEQEWTHWGEVLQPYAEKLAAVAARAEDSGEHCETEALDMGLNAWQMGGINCMRRLHSMAMEICRRKHPNTRIIDYVSIWWDGIGSWRNPALH